MAVFDSEPGSSCGNAAVLIFTATANSTPLSHFTAPMPQVDHTTGKGFKRIDVGLSADIATAQWMRLKLKTVGPSSWRKGAHARNFA